MVDIKPDRTNWRQFCQEPPLTDEEWAEWREMAEAIRQAEDEGDGTLFDFITSETQGECDEYIAREQEGWSGLVARSDANRRLERAEIAAWRRYNG